MRKNFKAKWLAALRGGKFKQARNDLVKKVRGGKLGMCCIGVGLAVKRGITAAKVEKTLGNDPTMDASKEIGLTYKEVSRLVTLNDEKRKNFKQIADWIEANL
jgi:hypothetical protein